MPAVNAYIRDSKFLTQFDKAAPALKSYIAEQLTCGDRTLQPNEVSIRLLEPSGKDMLADVEMDIFAAAYKERVDKQDEICLNVRKFILDRIFGLDDAQVWLMLSELGHSQES